MSQVFELGAFTGRPIKDPLKDTCSLTQLYYLSMKVPIFHEIFYVIKVQVV